MDSFKDQILVECPKLIKENNIECQYIIIPSVTLSLFVYLFVYSSEDDVLADRQSPRGCVKHPQLSGEVHLRRRSSRHGGLREYHNNGMVRQECYQCLSGFSSGLIGGCTIRVKIHP